VVTSRPFAQRIDRVLTLAVLTLGAVELSLLGLGRFRPELFFDAETVMHGLEGELAGELLPPVLRWIELGLLATVGALTFRWLGRRRGRWWLAGRLVAAGVLLALAHGWMVRHEVAYELRHPELRRDRIERLLGAVESAPAATRPLARRHGIPLEDPYRWQSQWAPRELRVLADGSVSLTGRPLLMRPRTMTAPALVVLDAEGEPQPTPPALLALFEVAAAVPLPDGSSVLLGSSRIPQPVEPRRPYRWTADGTFDLDFTDRLAEIFDAVRQLERSADGRILAAGTDLSGDPVLRRLTPDGRPDPSFAPTVLPSLPGGLIRSAEGPPLIWGHGDDGWWVRRPAPEGGFEAATDLPDGEPVTRLTPLPGGGFAVLRGNRDPKLERYSEVGDDAPELSLPKAFPDRVSNLLATPGGEIWGFGARERARTVGGYTAPASVGYLVRRGPRGRLLGATRIPGPGVVRASTLLPGGRVLAAATLGRGKVRLLWLSATGEVERASANFSLSRVRALELGAGGRILVAGRWEPPPMEKAYGALYRPGEGFRPVLSEPPTPPPTPPPASGRSTFDRPRRPLPELIFTQHTPGADGRIFAKATAPGERRGFPVRLSPGGELDQGFARRARQAFERLDRGAGLLHPLPDGTLLVGVSDGDQWQNPALVRLRPDGRLDPTFNPPNGNVESVHKVVPAADGTLWLTGRFHVDGESYGLLHLDADGHLLLAALGPDHLLEVKSTAPPPRRRR